MSKNTSVAFIGLKFKARVQLSVIEAFISAVSPMLCDPVVHLFTVHKESGARTQVGETSTKLFTAYPVWKENLEVTIEDPANYTLEIEVRDGTNATFLGANRLPVELLSDSSLAEPRRLMLLPRCALKSLSGPDTQREGEDSDLQHLRKYGCDDFGHLSVTWNVTLQPIGGVTELPESKPKDATRLPTSTYLSIVSQWLVPSSVSQPGTVYRAMMSLTNKEGEQPPTPAASTTTPIPSPEQQQQQQQLFPLENGVHSTNVVDGTRTPFVTIVLQRRNPTDINMDEMRLMPFPIPTQLDRTVYWTLPATSKHRPGISWGAVVVQVRASSSSTVPASTFTGATAKSPECFVTPTGPVHWETDAHVARSTERRWRRSCAVDAKPTPAHLRHLLDVLLKRASVDPTMTPLLKSFYSNLPQEEMDLREIIVALTFAASEVNIPEACRFAFAIMRSDAERAIRLNDVVFILENCLLPLSLDLSQGDLKKRVRDLFVTEGLQDEANPYIPFNTFMDTVSKHFSFWNTLGVCLDDERAASTATTTADDGEVGGDGGAKSKDENVWRHMTMRVIKTGRAFAVTAHIRDTVERVKSMITESVGIAVGRQQYNFGGVVLNDNSMTVAKAFPQSKIDQGNEVSIHEVEEVITVIFVHRGMHKKWEQKVTVTDKVLKLRGLIQRKTMIPLSRLHLTHAGQVLWDRHALEHYKMVDGSVIEVMEKH